MVQLHTGHILLNRHLHWLHKVGSDMCSVCKGHVESVTHYLLECCSYRNEREKMLRSIGCLATDLGTLFSSREGIKALLQYVKDIGRLRNSFGDVTSLNLIEMDNNLDTTDEGRSG